MTAVQFHQEHRQAVSSCRSSSKGQDYLLIDVRPQLETSICRLPEALNFPYRELEERADEIKDLIRQRLPSTASDASSPPLLPGLAYIIVRRDIRSGDPLFLSISANPSQHFYGGWNKLYAINSFLVVSLSRWKPAERRWIMDRNNERKKSGKPRSALSTKRRKKNRTGFYCTHKIPGPS